MIFTHQWGLKTDLNIGDATITQPARALRQGWYEQPAGRLSGYERAGAGFLPRERRPCSEQRTITILDLKVVLWTVGARLQSRLPKP
jgi:hypothetical protein